MAQGGGPVKDECQCCGYETELKTYRNQSFDPKIHIAEAEEKSLCALCASTLTGTFMDHPAVHGSETQVMQTICYVGNAILAAIKAAGRDK